MKFVVFTRFGIYINNDEWYEEQLNIFEKYAYSSLSSQTDLDFVWIVGIDENAPDSVRDRLSRMLSRLSFDAHLIIYKREEYGRFPKSGSTEWLYEEALDKIGRRNIFSDQNQFYISAMIDADDAWNISSVEKVKNYFDSKLPEILNNEEANGYLTGPSGGAVLTFTSGMNFFEHRRSFVERKLIFPSMSVFVLSRPISGISCHSGRHPAWKDLHKAFQFSKYVEHTPSQMWMYSKYYPSKRDLEEADFSNEVTFSSTEFKTTCEQFGLNPELLVRFSEKMSFSKSEDPKTIQNEFFKARWKFLTTRESKFTQQDTV